MFLLGLGSFALVLFTITAARFYLKRQFEINITDIVAATIPFVIYGLSTGLFQNISIGPGGVAIKSIRSSGDVLIDKIVSANKVVTINDRANFEAAHRDTTIADLRNIYISHEGVACAVLAELKTNSIKDQLELCLTTETPKYIIFLKDERTMIAICNNTEFGNFVSLSNDFGYRNISKVLLSPQASEDYFLSATSCQTLSSALHLGTKARIALAAMQNSDISWLPVSSVDGKFLGTVTRDQVTSLIVDRLIDLKGLN